MRNIKINSRFKKHKESGLRLIIQSLIQSMIFYSIQPHTFHQHLSNGTNKKSIKKIQSIRIIFFQHFIVSSSFHRSLFHSHSCFLFFSASVFIFTSTIQTFMAKKFDFYDLLETFFPLLIHNSSFISFL